MRRLSSDKGEQAMFSLVKWVCAIVLCASMASSQENDAPAAALGPETNLPMPRFVSLKASEANVRRGPSLTHRIDWVFKRRNMPLQVVAEYGHWRRVIDREGQGGWVHYTMISGTRTVIVDQDMLPLRARADAQATENAELQAGVIAKLDECGPAWCKLSVDGYRGWAPKDALWGVDAAELLD